MTVCGWAMLIWFLPSGMWGYAFDYIGMWIHRPKPMSPEQFTKAKTDLAQTIEILLKKGRELVEVKQQTLNEGKGKGRPLKRFLAKRKLNNEQHSFETNCQLIEAEFNKLDSVAAYASRVEPCKFFCYLLFGILMAIASLVFMTHIFCYLVVFKANGTPYNPFFNRMLSLIEASKVSFAAIPIFIIMGYYFLFCA